MTNTIREKRRKALFLFLGAVATLLSLPVPGETFSDNMESTATQPNRVASASWALTA
jgi:hypothetical protein